MSGIGEIHLEPIRLPAALDYRGKNKLAPFQNGGLGFGALGTFFERGRDQNNFRCSCEVYPSGENSATYIIRTLVAA